MQPQMREVKASQISQSTLDSINAKLGQHFTTLIKIAQREYVHEDAAQIGSGNFVSIDGIYGILTARHVSTRLDPPGSLGLTLISGEQKPKIDVNYIKIIDIPKVHGQSEEPDLSFIYLQPADAEKIKARKSFYDLSQKRDKALSNPPPLSDHILFIWGVPHEWTEEEKSEKGFSKILNFHPLSLHVRFVEEYNKGDYDYYKVEYGNAVGVPGSLSGFSGGGLWQVLLRQYDDGTIEAYDYILSGVHLGSEPQGRFVHCHGRKSIYNKLYGEVKRQYSSLSGATS